MSDAVAVRIIDTTLQKACIEEKGALTLAGMRLTVPKDLSGALALIALGASIRVVYEEGPEPGRGTLSSITPLNVDPQSAPAPVSGER